MALCKTIQKKKNILELFEPYKNILLTESKPGPTVRTVNKKKTIVFGARVSGRTESDFEELLHEVAHGIEIPQERFGYDEWGLHAKKSGGKKIWGFEREVSVAVIQRRLHTYFGEPLHWNEIFDSLESIGSKNEWHIKQKIKESKNTEGIYRYYENKEEKIWQSRIKKMMRIIDATLPSTEALIGRWHKKCEYVDAHIETIKSAVELRKEIITVKDPLSKSLRKKLNENKIVA